MIGTASRDGVAVLTLEGALTQGEWRDALDDVLTRFPERCAQGLILDYTRITWASGPSVVRRREMARDIVSRASHFDGRVAAVVPSEEGARNLDTARAVIVAGGVEFRVFRELSEAYTWVLQGRLAS